ncbi:MAG: hypothetical protein IPQ08_04740 [Chitinophagaceae bacterium]|nr:hypothetical protein [Chitinophagaceae bacterium]
MKRVIKLVLLLLIFSKADAQPFNLDDRIKPVELNLFPFSPPDQPKAKGRLNVTQVTQQKDTLYFFAKGASIYSPVYVGVTTSDKDHPIEVRLCKNNWSDFSRQGSTGSEGHWEDKFKTEGDFGIMVIAANKPAEYSLTVWNGDEAKFELPTVFSNDKTALDSKGGGSFLKNNLLYIVIGALVVLVAFLIFKLKTKKK